jgi:8-amino-7-oxononanoate synthase
MGLLKKLRPVMQQVAFYERMLPILPLDVAIDEIHGPCDVTIAGHRTLMFGSNNYLGLTFHPEVRAAAHAAIERYGTATTGSRVANGTLAIHKDLERAFAQRFGKGHALIFTTGCQANLAVIGTVCGPGDVALIDADSHASIYDATRLSGAEVLYFRHNSVENLETKLARLPAAQSGRLVVVEGLYSIGGDVAPLRDIAAACRAHGAYLLVDEAHSFGVYGTRGLGCCEDQGVLDQVDFIVGTFSKSLGGVGGFCVSAHPEFRTLHFLARAYVFTASGAPANVAGVRAALDVMDREPQLRERLWTNVRRLRAGLKASGHEIGDTESPLIPVKIGSMEATGRRWLELLERGVYVNIVIPPACPQDRCLLRVSCSAVHSAEQIDRALEAFADVSRGVPRAAPVLI